MARLRMRLPPWKYVGVLAWRTLIVWLALHVMIRAMGGPLVYTAQGMLFALAVILVVVLADAERRRERRFLGNLGVSRAGMGAVVVGADLVLEGLLGIFAGGLPL